MTFASLPGGFSPIAGHYAVLRAAQVHEAGAAHASPAPAHKAAFAAAQQLALAVANEARTELHHATPHNLIDLLMLVIVLCEEVEGRTLDNETTAPLRTMAASVMPVAERLLAEGSMPRTVQAPFSGPWAGSRVSAAVTLLREAEASRAASWARLEACENNEAAEQSYAEACAHEDAARLALARTVATSAFDLSIQADLLFERLSALSTDIPILDAGRDDRIVLARSLATGARRLANGGNHG